LPLPEVVVCNWNAANSSTYKSPENCDYCQLDLVACTFINTSENCVSSWKNATYETQDGLYTCYTFNSNPATVTWTDSTAYGGAFVTIFKVKIQNETGVPTPVSARAGIQIVFGVPGTITATEVYSTVYFAGISSDTFYAINTLNTIHTELSSSDPGYNTTSYETSSSSVVLMNGVDSNNNGYIAISFGFTSLNVEVISYGHSYSLSNFFGDMAGMIGILTGLNFVKCLALLPLAWISLKMKKCAPWADRFYIGA